MTTQATVTKANVVIVEWTNLVAAASSSSASSSEIEQLLEQAYGPTGTGILAIRGVPGFVEAKNGFLPEAHKLATLPTSYLEEHLTDAKSLYNAGWSHGKEKLGANKPPDKAKGSFYFNPISDLPGTAEQREQYPYSYPLNVWPDDSVLPGFADKARAIGKILLQACEQVARHVDALAAKSCPSYPNNLLYNNIQGTDKVKARLLYYFPLNPPSEQLPPTTTSTPEDSWIGWHNDSGFLTALAGDLYVDHDTGQPVDCPDPAAGLYVVDRTHATTPTTPKNHRTATTSILHVQLPSDCLAVQMGECTQIVTGGTVRATPHCVRGACAGGDQQTRNNIARISLPCFVDTPPTFALTVPDGIDERTVLQSTVTDKVPPLSERWNNGDTFGTFLQTTFSVYYNWKA